MTPEELAAIRERHDPMLDAIHHGVEDSEVHALLAHIDAITEILRPEHESPYHKAMVGGCLVCAFLRDTSR